jgi:hypothetical protein
MPTPPERGKDEVLAVTHDSSGTEEYSPGTEEYSASTEEYSSQEARSVDDAREWLKAQKPWWEREGYASLADALADSVAMADRVMGRKPRDLRGLSLEDVIFSKPERPPRERRNPRIRGRQVNIKLTEEERSRLSEAARAYGLPPSTLARAFVVRATEAVLDG